MEEIHRINLEALIQDLIEDGNNLSEILYNCESADPRLVEEIISEKSHLFTNSLGEIKTKFIGVVSNDNLPAPDSSLSQWWFAPEAVGLIFNKTNKLLREISEPKILCIGTPTIAIQLASKYSTTLLDVDIDIIDMLRENSPSSLECHQYDVANKLDVQFKNKFDLVIIDPPWYDNFILTNVNVAFDALKLNGSIFGSYPGRLARPKVEETKFEFIKKLVNSGHKINSFEQDIILYQVPYFENKAFEDLKYFSGLPWRKGDFFHIVKGSDNYIKVEKKIDPYSYVSYSRAPKEFRVYSRRESSLSSNITPKVVLDFSKQISTRSIEQQPDIWTTEKNALKVGNIELAEGILECWSNNMNLKDTFKFLSDTFGDDNEVIDAYIHQIDKELRLWSHHSAPPFFKEAQDINDNLLKNLSGFAVKKNDRITKEDSDNYRPPFSRDRDRIIWSNSLRRLADKTQLFPSSEDDTVRRRLTHTLEVKQLASTIGTSLGLNNDLIEACALAHDLGHTPFGHAGEHAINSVLNEIDHKLDGFNHYEHGVDVVKYIESPYRINSEKPFDGLNLSKEVMEATLKHVYNHSEGKVCSISLQKNSKHRFIPEGYCHLEGQAVRLADKISYFISDIEDGLKIGAINELDLRNCRFFRRLPLFFNSESNESPLNQFLSQRRFIIKILMEDAIDASTKRISKLNLTNDTSARKQDEYCINHSSDIGKDVGEVWNKLQEGLLFEHPKVKSANLQAAKIISELLILFTLMPTLIDKTFVEDHKPLWNGEYINFYKEKVGKSIDIKKELTGFVPFHGMIGESYSAFEDIKDIKIEHLILAKDYTASLSDFMARKLHSKLLEY